MIESKYKISIDSSIIALLATLAIETIYSEVTFLERYYFQKQLVPIFRIWNSYGLDMVFIPITYNIYIILELPEL